MVDMKPKHCLGQMSDDNCLTGITQSLAVLIVEITLIELFS
jgi:hypothetical protein